MGLSKNPPFLPLLEHFIVQAIHLVMAGYDERQRDVLGAVAYARERLTIRVNVGRLQGHTTCMVKLATDDDAVLVRTGQLLSHFVRQRYEYERREPQLPGGSLGSDGSVPDRLRSLTPRRIVWVDSPGRVPLDEVYRAFSTPRTIFVVLGD